MNRLNSRRNLGRFTPRVEALEDRSLLSATIIGQPFGTIATTGAVNKVVITDDGSFIRVFSDNSPLFPLAFFSEGTPISVKTIHPGSTNNIFYFVQGVSRSSPIINANLSVDFGTGNGLLEADVVSSLPTNLFAFPGPVTRLTSLSNLRIAVKSGGGNTQTFLDANGIGSSANLQFREDGGKGSDFFQAVFGFGSTQEFGSTVGIAFFGGDGNDTAGVFDFENIQSGASATFSLHGQQGNDTLRVVYIGQLNGNLSATADGGPGDDVIFMQFNLASGSNTGSLTSSANGGPGNDRVTDIVHKLNTDTTTVLETANGGTHTPPGKDIGTFTFNSPTSVAVLFTNFQQVSFVP
jgi:hypothetical protein